MRSILIDTNPLVLFLVGSVDPGAIGKKKRVREFDFEDWQNLCEQVEQFPRQITLPNILTEASNLIDSGEREIVPGASAALAHFSTHATEIYEVSQSAMRQEHFRHVGLTDAAIIQVARRKGSTVVTVDHELHGRLAQLGLNTVNLRHFRTPR